MAWYLCGAVVSAWLSGLKYNMLYIYIYVCVGSAAYSLVGGYKAARHTCTPAYKASHTYLTGGLIMFMAVHCYCTIRKVLCTNYSTA